MKKIVALVLCLVLVSTLFTGAVATPEVLPEVLPGLQENLDVLWLKNNFTQEQVDDMVTQWEQRFAESFWETAS